MPSSGAPSVSGASRLLASLYLTAWGAAEHPVERASKRAFACNGRFIDACYHGPLFTRTLPATATLFAFAATVACRTRPAPAEWPGSTRSLPTSETATSGSVAPAAADTEQIPALAGHPRVPLATSERLIEPSVLANLVAATDKPYESQGHEPPSTLVRVLVSPESVQAYRSWGPGSSLPRGSWLVARHSWRDYVEGEGPNRTDPAPLYVMYRDVKGWTYAAANAEGRKIPVVEGVCQDCHTQARSDSVFGPPAKSATAGLLGSKTTP
jgi:hypothetical protein